MRPDPRLRRRRGFAVAFMLVLVAVVALAGAAAVQDVLFAQQMATSRTQQQRAMGHAELGLRIGMQQLAAGGPPPESGELRPGPTQADSLRITLAPGAMRVPQHFSAGRFVVRDYEIHSTGGSARNAQRTLVQGVTRLEPLADLP